jgi:lipid II:glycine glycyltransferase (peptidoglycan interpeptide bridge formation enzyme)
VKYFLRLWDSLSSKNMLKISMADYQGQTIAASMFLLFNKRILYVYGASDQNFLKHRPNNLVLWSMMEWGCNSGYTHFDLGGTPKENEGLLNFKGKWGGENASYPYYFYPEVHRAVIENKNSMLQKYGALLIKKMPVRYSKYIGYPLIKMFG